MNFIRNESPSKTGFRSIADNSQDDNGLQNDEKFHNFRSIIECPHGYSPIKTEGPQKFVSPIRLCGATCVDYFGKKNLNLANKRRC